jgi:hypothetical protein
MDVDRAEDRETKASFNHENFCENAENEADVIKAYLKENVVAATWVTDIRVNCRLRFVNFEQPAGRNSDNASARWLRDRQRAFDKFICSTAETVELREAVEAGWTMANTLEFRDGGSKSIKAVCS